MRIADIVAALERRPVAIVPGSDGAVDLARRTAATLGLAQGTGADGGDGPVVVLVVVDETAIGQVVGAALERTGGIGADAVCLVLLDAQRDGLPVEEVTSLAGEHDLELREVIDVAHPVLPTGLLLVPADDALLGVARTELVVEREVSRRARTAASANARELRRRGERIDALTSDVAELRERLETLQAQHSRALEGRDRELVVLRRDVRQLERSTSYRIGHALVRLVKNPGLVRRVPGRLLRWLRS